MSKTTFILLGITYYIISVIIIIIVLNKINKKEKKEIIPIRDVILTVSAKWIS